MRHTNTGRKLNVRSFKVVMDTGEEYMLHQKCNGKICILSGEDGTDRLHVETLEKMLMRGEAKVVMVGYLPREMQTVVTV